MLGLAWLLDGVLQFQSFMYSRGFVATLEANLAGQPPWLHATIFWAAHLASRYLTVANTLFALTQLALGIGLLYRPTVRPALLASFAWALVVWWFGEGFGGLLAGAASPLTGAPGAALMYALVGLSVWPARQPGGLLGARGARIMWGVLWLVMAWLWLMPPSARPDAFAGAMRSTPSGVGWLTSLQSTVGSWTHGNGAWLALLCAALSAAVALSALLDRRAGELLIVSAAFNLLLWVLPQGLGGIFAGGATDPSAGPLFILLAYLTHTAIQTGHRRPVSVPDAKRTTRRTPARTSSGIGR